MSAAPLGRTLRAAVAGAVLCLSIAACGGSSSDSSSTASSTTAAKAAATVPAGQPVGKFPGVTITVSRWAGDPWEGVVRQAAQDWSAATGGKVNIDVSAPDLRQKQVLGFTQKSGQYDVVYVLPNWFGEYVKSGFLRPIDDFLKDPSKNTEGFSTNEYRSDLFELGNVDGKQYSIPDFVSTVALGYRKDLFDKAGLQPPKTWDDVLADAKALNKDGMAGITIPGKKSFGSITDLMSTFLINQGAWWYGPDGKDTLDANAAKKAMEFYVALSKYAPKGILNFHYDEAGTAAANGKAAMIIANTPSFAWLDDPKRSRTVGKWAFAPLAAPGQSASGQLMYWHWAIPADAKNPEAAYSFIQYLTSVKTQTEFAIKGGTLGPEQSMFDDSALDKQVPFLTTLATAIQRNKPQPDVAPWPQAQEIIENSVQAALSGKQSPDAAAQTIVDGLKKVLG
jgi:multiple sugar transport system substrate-binding protein